jgi:hypothetical protein
MNKKINPLQKVSKRIIVHVTDKEGMIKFHEAMKKTAKEFFVNRSKNLKYKYKGEK